MLNFTIITTSICDIGVLKHAGTKVESINKKK